MDFVGETLVAIPPQINLFIWKYLTIIYLHYAHNDMDIPEADYKMAAVQ